MSVEAFYGLPVQVGQAVLSGMGRVARWSLSTYFAAPLRNTAIAALTGLAAMAGANALYNQTGQHPAPLFGSHKVQSPSQKIETPVMPAQRPAQLLSSPTPETTGSVTPRATPASTDTRPIGNEDVFEVQRKLTAFKFFSEKVDGIYGPKTARAIRAFEASIGRRETGQFTPEIVEIIRSMPITAEPGRVETAAPLVASNVVEPLAQAPAAAALEAEASAVAEQLPAPAVLSVTDTSPPPNPVAAGSGVSSLEMTSPPSDAAQGPTKRTVQTIEVRSPAAAAPVETMAPVAGNAVIDVVNVATDPKVVGAIQRGLSSLGFLHGQVDGVAGEATAKAIRNFEVYFNYNVTGRITPELVNLLVQNGAVI